MVRRWWKVVVLVVVICIECFGGGLDEVFVCCFDMGVGFPWV